MDADTLINELSRLSHDEIDALIALCTVVMQADGDVASEELELLIAILMSAGVSRDRIMYTLGSIARM